MCSCCAQVRSIQGEVEALKSEKSELQTTLSGLKKAVDGKEDTIRALQAEKSTLEDVAQSPSGREANRLTRQLAEKERIVQDLTARLAAKTSDLQLAEEQQRTAEDKARHLRLEMGQLTEKERDLQGLKDQLRQKESRLRKAEDRIVELRQQSQDTGRAELQSPTSPRAPLPAAVSTPVVPTTSGSV